MADFEVAREGDRERFLALVADLAAEGAAPFHVLATVSDEGRPGALMLVVSSGGRAVGAAVRVPRHPLVVSPLPEGAAEPLADAALEGAQDVDVVAGPEPGAGRVAAALGRATGRRARVTMAQVLHELGEPVRPSPLAPGRMRAAGEEDLPVLSEWWPAFGRDVGLADEVDLERVAALVRAGRVSLWDDGGPACMVGRTRPVLGLVRIAPVYTPPGRRGRGYASAAVWAVSRAAVERGARCMLYTDAANPTSNAVYRRVGYEPAGQAAMYGLEPAGRG